MNIGGLDGQSFKFVNVTNANGRFISFVLNLLFIKQLFVFHRVASMPNTGVEEEYYRLRHFSITGKGVVNRGGIH